MKSKIPHLSSRFLAVGLLSMGLCTAMAQTPNPATPRLVEFAQASVASGEPILRPLACVFPNGGYENVKDAFLMGDDLLVAPMVGKGTSRRVQIPPGKWWADDGSEFVGPVEQSFEIPLDRLLYFERESP